MRTFPVSALLLGMAAVIGMSRCAPVPSSLQKGVPGFGTIGPTQPDLGSDDQAPSFAHIVPESSAPAAAAAGNASTKEVTSSALKTFKDAGEVELPPEANGDPAVVVVVIGVNLTQEQIQDMKITQLPLTPVMRSEVTRLVISSENALKGLDVRNHATSIAVTVDETVSAKSARKRKPRKTK